MCESGFGFGQLEVAQVRQLGERWVLVFTCHPHEMTEERRVSSGDYCTWSVPCPDGGGALGPWDFHTEKWEAAYIRRVDATMAALKSSGVPVIWVGLPPQRATKVSSDSAYLNEIYRSRAETEQDFYVGARQDVLRRVAGAWKIAGRKIILDQNVLLAKNVSIFF